MEVMLVSKERDLYSALRGNEFVHWAQKPNLDIVDNYRKIFVHSPATKLPEYTDFLHAAVKRRNLCALFIYEDIENDWLPQMLARAKIRTLKHIFVHKELDIPRRIISAWTSDIQKETIADATVFDDRLMVLACDLMEYEISFDSIAALKNLPPEERSNFIISSDGSFIHWPVSDVHLNMDAFMYVTDSTYREKVDKKRLTKNKNYGEVIAKLRKLYGLRQSDILGLSERQVRRIEHGGSVTSNVLKALASAHGIELNEYLDQLANMIH